MMSKNFFKNKYIRGLTIIELLVVVSIFVIVTGLSIFNYNSFNSSISTQNLADDIALTIRRAQGYAIGVSGLGVEGPDNFKYGYGVHFTSNPNPSSPNTGSNISFILFVDINDDGHYNYNEEDSTCGTPSEGNECLEVLSIKSNDEIKDIYIEESVEPIGSNNVMDIIFKRPNPEPSFSDLSKKIIASSIKIKVVNTNDQDNIYKLIRVSNTGQISVSNE